jgi:hypothetical protein
MDLLIEAMDSLASFDGSSDRTAGAHELVQLGRELGNIPSRPLHEHRSMLHLIVEHSGW